MAEKKIRRIEIEPDDHGGHTVHAQFREQPSHSSKNGMGMSYIEPEKKVFGKAEGSAMLAHVANHLGISETEPEEA